jgi:hypothetical protein
MPNYFFLSCQSHIRSCACLLIGATVHPQSIIKNIFSLKAMKKKMSLRKLDFFSGGFWSLSVFAFHFKIFAICVILLFQVMNMFGDCSLLLQIFTSTMLFNLTTIVAKHEMSM